MRDSEMWCHWFDQVVQVLCRKSSLELSWETKQRTWLNFTERTTILLLDDLSRWFCERSIYACGLWPVRQYAGAKESLATKFCFWFRLPGLSFDQNGTTMQRQQTCCSLYMHEILCYEQLLLATFLEVTTLPPPKNCFHSNYVVP